MGILVDTYIFGSVGRGEQDDKSDLDILAVVKNQRGVVPDIEVTKLVPDQYRDLKASIAWYGETRLREMFKNGELFAWHLFLEAVPLHGTGHFLRSLGNPNAYTDSIPDALSFKKVLDGVPTQIACNAFNAVYESGLIYVCLRNIAMAASSVLNEQPDFSRYSPYNLKSVPTCPIQVGDYEITMACRLSGQRGLAPPKNVDAAFVRRLHSGLAPWITEVLSIMKGQESGQR